MVKYVTVLVNTPKPSVGLWGRRLLRTISGVYSVSSVHPAVRRKTFSTLFVWLLHTIFIIPFPSRIFFSSLPPTSSSIFRWVNKRSPSVCHTPSVRCSEWLSEILKGTCFVEEEGYGGKLVSGRLRGITLQTAQLVDGSSWQDERGPLRADKLEGWMDPGRVHLVPLGPLYRVWLQISHGFQASWDGPESSKTPALKSGLPKAPATGRYSVPQALWCSGPEANKTVLMHKPQCYATVSGPGTKACYDFRAWIPVTWGGDTLRWRKKADKSTIPKTAASETKGENLHAVGSVGTH